MSMEQGEDYIALTRWLENQMARGVLGSYHGWGQDDLADMRAKLRQEKRLARAAQRQSELLARRADDMMLAWTAEKSWEEAREPESSEPDEECGTVRWPGLPLPEETDPDEERERGFLNEQEQYIRSLKEDDPPSPWWVGPGWYVEGVVASEHDKWRDARATYVATGEGLDDMLAHVSATVPALAADAVRSRDERFAEPKTRTTVPLPFLYTAIIAVYLIGIVVGVLIARG